MIFKGLLRKLSDFISELAYSNAELDYLCLTCNHPASIHGSATTGPCGYSPNDVRGSCAYKCGCNYMNPPMRFHKDRKPEVLDLV